MVPSSSPVAIVGAGYLGSAVARALSQRVIVLNRRGTWGGPGPRPEHVQPIALDLMAPALDLHALRASHAALLCYAPRHGQDRRGLYVESTRRLLEGWGAGTLRRLVWIGSTSALPDRDAWLDERCTDEPAGERGRVQRDAERVVIEHATRHGIPWLVLRLGGLYGPGRELSRIYARRHDGPLAGDGMAPTNLVHLRDATAAAIAALRAPASCEGIVHVVDDDHTPRREMYARMARHRGLPPLAWAEPPPADGRARGKRVSNRRLKQWLGIRLWAPTHRGSEETEP